MKIKVSIIIPFYTVCESFLRECLDSIAVQEMQEMECLLVSDGAPEKEVSICKEYCIKDSRFRIIQKEHAGVSAARNLGIKEAQGEYITFVDSDDWIDKDTCQLVYKAACESKTDIVLWECAEVSASKKIKKIFSFNTDCKEKLLSQVFIRNNITATLTRVAVCKLFRTDFIRQHNLSYNEKMVLDEDTIFNFQAMEKGTIITLSRCLYYWREHPNSSCRKYRENLWPIMHSIVLQYKEIAPTYYKQISNAAFFLFFECWGKCYFNKQNSVSIKESVNEVISLWNSQDLQYFLTNLDLKDIPLFYKIETWFLRHKIYILLWIHAIKNRLF